MIGLLNNICVDSSERRFYAIFEVIVNRISKQLKDA